MKQIIHLRVVSAGLIAILKKLVTDHGFLSSANATWQWINKFLLFFLADKFLLFSGGLCLEDVTRLQARSGHGF